MNTKQTEALKLALEVLEECRRDPRLKYEHPYYDKTITAIREALAEQPAQQQEVDWEKLYRLEVKKKEALAAKYERDTGKKLTRIVPMAEQPAQQEPVAWMYQNKSTHEVSFQKHMRSFVDHGAWYEVPLYSEPLANQEKTSGSPKPAKPEALRLADAMEYDLDWCDEAAAELRRMHDLLGKANALCRIRVEEIERLKAQPEQEPVAWRWVPSKVFPDYVISDDPEKARSAASHGMNIEPLYTSPQPSKPLTDEQIMEMYNEPRSDAEMIAFARAIEAAHGIGEQK